MHERISQQALFIAEAFLTAQRSTCLSRQVGAVIVKNGHLIASGYNGAPTGAEHCSDNGVCIRKSSTSGENLDECLAVHAETNAIIQCAVLGVSTADSEIYCTDFPCAFCLKAIINAKIRKLYYVREYKNPVREQLENFVEIEKLKLELEINVMEAK